MLLRKNTAGHADQQVWLHVVPHVDRLQRRAVRPGHDRAHQRSHRQCGEHEQHGEQRAEVLGAEVGPARDARAEEDFVHPRLVVAQHGGAHEGTRDDLTDCQQHAVQLGKRVGAVLLHLAQHLPRDERLGADGEERHEEDDGDVEPRDRSAEVAPQFEGE